MINLFGNKPSQDPEVTGRIRTWVRELLNLPEDVTVTVTQLSCAEEDCPDVETVIGVLEPGSQRVFKILKPLIEVQHRDLVEAVGRRP